MSEQKKPSYREFWVREKKYSRATFVRTILIKEHKPKSLNEEVFKVIEYSALEAAQKRIAELEERCNQEQNDRANAIFKMMDAIEKHDSLKEKADKLRDVFVKYAYEEPALAKAIQQYNTESKEK